MVMMLRAICFILLPALISCKLYLTNEPLSISDYPKVCHAKGLRAARLTDTNIAAAANLLRQADETQAWVRSFNGKYWEGYDLTVKLVRRSRFAKWYAKWSWLEYGPEVELLESKHKLLPVVCPIKRPVVKRRHSNDSDSTGNDNDNDDDDSEDYELHGLCEDIPEAELVQQQQQQQQQVWFDDSNATVILQATPAVIQRSQAPRAHQVAQSPQSDKPRARRSSLTITPVFNPPPNAPASAFVDQRTGRLPADGAHIMVPVFVQDQQDRQQNSRPRRPAETGRDGGGGAYASLRRRLTFGSNKQADQKDKSKDKKKRKGSKKSKSGKKESSSSSETSSTDDDKSSKVIYEEKKHKS